MIPAPWPHLAAGARFTQPRDHSLADRCTYPSTAPPLAVCSKCLLLLLLLLFFPISFMGISVRIYGAILVSPGGRKTERGCNLDSCRLVSTKAHHWDEPDERNFPSRERGIGHYNRTHHEWHAHAHTLSHDSSLQTKTQSVQSSCQSLSWAPLSPPCRISPISFLSLYLLQEYLAHNTTKPSCRRRCLALCVTLITLSQTAETKWHPPQSAKGRRKKERKRNSSWVGIILLPFQSIEYV